MDEAYEAFLQSHEASLLYHSCKYRDLLTGLLSCTSDYLVALEGEEIRGVLPIMSMDGPRGRVHNSLPYYGSNGGVISQDRAASAMLISAYNELVSQRGALAATLITNPLAPASGDGASHNYVDQRIGLMTRLPTEANAWDAIMARIQASARRNIRKAAREGVRVAVEDGQLVNLARMHQQNLGDIGGRPKSRSFFESVERHFRAEHDFDVYVARLDGLIVAGLLVFYYNKTVEYFTPAVERQFRTFQPLALIVITAMAEAARRGFTQWNWGGTWLSQLGVYRFKKKWDPEEMAYHYYTQLNDPAVLDQTPEKLLSEYPDFFVVPFSALRSALA